MLKIKKLISFVLFLLVSVSAFGAGLDLEYRCIATAATTGQIIGEVQITNTGSTINLSDLTFEYYYTKEGTASESAYTDFADVTGSTYKQVTNDTTRTFNEGFIQYGFTASAGTLVSGDKLRLQFRIHKNDWSNYDQSNDASFDPSYGSLAPYDKITLNGGSVVVGDPLNVEGYIIDLNSGTPLYNVTVTAGSDTASTDKDGKYSIDTEITGGEVVITAACDGYGPYQKVIGGIDNADLDFDFKMKAAGLVTVINPANYQGTVLETLSGASVSLPPIYGLQENLKISVTSYDASTEDLEVAPGNYRALNSNDEEVSLISQGMIDVDIRGTNTGDYYSLEGYGSYEIKIPVTGDPSNAPAIIDLWYYDMDQQTWIEEGTATKVGDVYVGTVTHFSTWNSDIAFYDNLILSANISDSSGSGPYEVRISSPGYFYKARVQNDTSINIQRLPQNTAMKLTVMNTVTKAIGVVNFTTTGSSTYNAGTVTLVEPVSVSGTIVGVPVPYDGFKVEINSTKLDYSQFIKDTSIFVNVPPNDSGTIKVTNPETGESCEKPYTSGAAGTSFNAGDFTLTINLSAHLELNSGQRPFYLVNGKGSYVTGVDLGGTTAFAPNGKCSLSLEATGELHNGSYEHKWTAVLDIADLNSSFDLVAFSQTQNHPIVAEPTVNRRLRLVVTDGNGNSAVSVMYFIAC